MECLAKEHLVACVQRPTYMVMKGPRSTLENSFLRPKLEEKQTWRCLLDRYSLYWMPNIYHPLLHDVGVDRTISDKYSSNIPIKHKWKSSAPRSSSPMRRTNPSMFSSSVSPPRLSAICHEKMLLTKSKITPPFRDREKNLQRSHVERKTLWHVCLLFNKILQPTPSLQLVSTFYTRVLL